MGQPEGRSTENVENLAEKFMHHYYVMQSNDYDDGEKGLITDIFQVMIENGDILEGPDAAETMEEQLEQMRATGHGTGHGPYVST